MVWREFRVGVVGSGESSRLEGREGRVEQRRVKCCRAGDFKVIGSRSSKEEPGQLGEKKGTSLGEMAQVTGYHIKGGQTFAQPIEISCT